jgi:hypothetical protein
VKKMTEENKIIFPDIDELSKKLLEERGVKIMDIAKLVYFLQKDYHP